MRELRKNPEIEAKRAAAFKRALTTNPELFAKHASASAARLAKWRTTPGAHASIKANAIKASAASNTPEARARRAASIRQTMTGWCPDDRRAEYLELRRYHGAAEARRIVEADLAAKEKARLGALSPFERQMERVRNGAKLVEKPVFRTRDPDFTLGGIASAAL